MSVKTLPIHPQPLPEELLSSWMVRLALANRFSLHTFYNKVIGYNGQIWTRDVDRSCSYELIDLLHQYTKQPRKVIQSLSLSSYEGLLFESLSSNALAPWILSAGIFHRKRRNAALQYCPLCLREDSTPYFRKTWRLAFYVLCEHHNCLMESTCPSCKQPVLHHRIGIGKENTVPHMDISLCHYCGYCLKYVTPRYLYRPGCVAKHYLLKLLKHHSNGPWKCGNNLLSFGLAYFKGIWFLLSSLRSKKATVLREEINRATGLHLKASRYHTFEGADHSERLEYMLCISWILSGWPKHYLSACYKANYVRSSVAENPKKLPYWFNSIIDSQLGRKVYIRSDEEMLAACHYLYSQKQRVTRANIISELGFSSDQAIRAAKIWARL